MNLRCEWVTLLIEVLVVDGVPRGVQIGGCHLVFLLHLLTELRVYQHELLTQRPDGGIPIEDPALVLFDLVFELNELCALHLYQLLLADAHVFGALQPVLELVYGLLGLLVLGLEILEGLYLQPQLIHCLEELSVLQGLMVKEFLVCHHRDGSLRP